MRAPARRGAGDRRGDGTEAAAAAGRQTGRSERRESTCRAVPCRAVSCGVVPSGAARRYRLGRLCRACRWCRLRVGESLVSGVSNQRARPVSAECVVFPRDTVLCWRCVDRGSAVRHPPVAGVMTPTEDGGLGRRGSDPLQPHSVQVYVTDESENSGDGRRGPPQKPPPGKRSPWWTVLSLGSVSGKTVSAGPSVGLSQ